MKFMQIGPVPVLVSTALCAEIMESALEVNERHGCIYRLTPSVA